MRDTTNIPLAFADCARGCALLAAALAVILAAHIGLSVPAHAQSDWRMPWDTQTMDRREPARRAPVPRAQQPSARTSAAESGNICLDLERRLATEVNRGRDGGERRNQLISAVRILERQVSQNETRLERSSCWDQFFFQRTLRNTRACVSVYRQLETQRRRLQDTRNELDAINDGSRQSVQDEIMRALARNRCGSAYEQQARRSTPDNPFASFFQDYDSRVEGERNTYRGLPFATYRTLCVRTCDGYYFPISFSTLPNYFERDAEACQSKCAAPVTLYYHQNPGGSIDQMKSVIDNTTYTDLTTAFKYRKSFVKGCSCKASEYVPNGVQVEESVQADTRRQLSPVR
jgi:hypothetical protein